MFYSNLKSDKYEASDPAPEIDDSDPDMTPEIQEIFDRATDARKMYNEINDKYNDIDRRVEDIRDQEEKDFGPDDVFLSMYKECFELKTTEYIYKVHFSYQNIVFKLCFIKI